MLLEFHLSLQILQWLMISMHSLFFSYQVVLPVLKVLAHMHTSLYHRFNTSQPSQRCPLVECYSTLPSWASMSTMM
jgi:hypothetical protein